jgi:hypothetical protein
MKHRPIDGCGIVAGSIMISRLFYIVYGSYLSQAFSKIIKLPDKIKMLYPSNFMGFQGKRL